MVFWLNPGDIRGICAVSVIKTKTRQRLTQPLTGLFFAFTFSIENYVPGVGANAPQLITSLP
jgi:hypothetical protein